MHSSLYLDTARLGQMSREACNASIDFARFANEHGCTLYFSQLLREGFSRWPGFLQRQYSGLSNWGGVCKLKRRLRTLAQAKPDSEVILASRSASLMKIAGRLLAGPCRRVLTTDSCWPAYRKSLSHELSRTRNQLEVVAIRDLCLRGTVSTAQLIDFIANEFVSRKCDGLFLPLVDNLGVHLPVEDLVNEIRRRAELRFVVIDGAQAIGHVPLRLNSYYCDFLLAGTHKWLRAFYTMGVGFYGSPGSRDYISDSIGRWKADGTIDDPLMGFCDELTAKTHSHYGETVQVAPLLIGDSALTRPSPPESESAAVRKANWRILDEVARISGWRVVSPCDDMRSQIVLAEPKRLTKASANAIEESLVENRISATTYPDGLLRLSMPDIQIQMGERLRLINALSKAGRSPHQVSINLQSKTLLGDGCRAIDI